MFKARLFNHAGRDPRDALDTLTARTIEKLRDLIRKQWLPILNPGDAITIDDD